MNLQELATQFDLPALGLISEDPIRLIVDGWSERANEMARVVSRDTMQDVYVFDFKVLPRAHPFLHKIFWVGEPLISYWPPGKMSTLPSVHAIVYPLGGFLI